jgi:hypothetical protein
MNKRYPKPYKIKLARPEKYVGDVNNVVIRSSWEKKFVTWCENNNSVLKWGSELVAVPYYSKLDMKLRKYYPDFWIQILKQDGTTDRLIIEIKPYSQTIPPVKGRKQQKTIINEVTTYQLNADKWSAMDDWAKKNGWKFIIMTEYELGIAKR